MFLKGFTTYPRDVLKLMQRIYQWFLPYACLLCSLPTKKIANICEDCQKDLPILPQCCLQCANFLHTETEIGNELLCGACQSSPPPFERTYALFPYKSPIIQLIIQLKFQGKLEVAKFFGEMFSEKIKIWYKDSPLPDRIIPIPLHMKRLRERGFNQALEIARPIAKSLGIPIDFANSLRIKNTKPQSSLTKDEREDNLKGAFSVLKNYTGLKLAVIDDVVTTGETMRSFCQMLKSKGASSIHVWCQARRG